jgi:hypothetical protein
MITALVIVACAAAIAAAFIMLNSQRLKARIDANYASVQTPPWLYLSHQKYQERSLWDDTPAVEENWTYTYLPVAKEVTLQEMHDLLAKMLESAGYSVVANTNPDPSSLTSLVATGKNLDLRVTINADTSESGGYYKPTSTVQDVQVQAHE